MQNKVKAYAMGIIIPVAVGLLAAFLTRDSMDIYQSIVQPDLAPPAILFPIVWTVLYILMGIESAVIYTSDADANDKRQALLLYGLQLAVNFFGAYCFFKKGRIYSALFGLYCCGY